MKSNMSIQLHVSNPNRVCNKNNDKELVMEMQITYEINFDNYTVNEIKEMIDSKLVSEEEVKSYYGNEWWNETP